MSKTAVIVVMLLAALLLGAWLFLGGARTPSQGTLGSPILNGFDPNAVETLRVFQREDHNPSQSPLVFTSQGDHRALGYEWTLSNRIDSKSVLEWPAEP